MHSIKFYCIYKKNDSRSENLLAQNIESAKNFNITVIPFEGVYKNIDQLIKKFNLTINPLGQHKIKTTGVLGCFLSHYLLWTKCLNQKQHIGVLEYDAKFINPLKEKITDYFSDYLNLDYCRHLYLDTDQDYESIVTVANKSPLIKKLEETNTESKFKKPFKYINNNHIKGAFGYIISPNGAAKLINATNKYGILPADIQPNLMYCEMFYTEPSVVMLNPSSLINRAKHSHTTNNHI